MCAEPARHTSRLSHHPCFSLSLQVRFVLSVLEDHPALPTVVVSDSDTVWLRSPFPYLEQRRSAEFFISSDCLSHQVGSGAGGGAAGGQGLIYVGGTA